MGDDQENAAAANDGGGDGGEDGDWETDEEPMEQSAF